MDFLHPALPSAQGHIHHAADAADHPSPSASTSRINLHRYRAAALKETPAMPFPAAIAIPLSKRECVKILSPVRYGPRLDIYQG
jgi:hypothetical protein